MRHRTVARDVGRILQAKSLMVVVSLLVALGWRELYAVPGLVVTGALAAGCGTLLVRAGRDAPPPDKLHGMIVAASGWLAVAVVGAVPFLVVAWTVAADPPGVPVPPEAGSGTLAAFRNPLNALFEGMSGFTGTGLTMTVHEDELPRTLQWWRSFTEWVGGVGVIVLTTAVLSRPGSGSLTLYESEARSEKIHPSVVSTVRTIWWIFILFTLAAVALLRLAGMPPWHAVNHAMTGLATGGFSVTDASIASYGSPLVEYALVPIMVAGSIAFPIHYLMLRGDIRNVYTDLQTRWLLGSLLGGSTVVSLLLAANGTYGSAGAAVRYGLFQFVSAMSCTGFQTATDLGRAWSPATLLVVTLGMVVGGAAGSTVGGVKLIRVLTLGKGVLFRVRGVFFPEAAVRQFTLDDRSMSESEAARELEEAALVTLLWLTVLLGGTFVLLVVLPDRTLATVIFEVASAQGNVGLSTGITGPGMPAVAKVTFLVTMWIGRLEILPVLVFLRALLRPRPAG